MLSPLVRALSVEAPNVTVHLLPRSKASKEMLTTNRADIVIEPEGLFGEGDFPSQHLISDRWLCAVDSASPHASQEKISKREFLDLPHAVYGLGRSEEHTSELQSLMRISYAVFCLKKKKNKNTRHTTL